MMNDSNIECIDNISLKVINGQTKEDILFLLSFVPALDIDAVIPDLCSTFYFTGSYDGDKKLVSKIESIVKRYEINVDDVDDVEEFS